MATISDIERFLHENNIEEFFGNNDIFFTRDYNVESNEFFLHCFTILRRELTEYEFILQIVYKVQNERTFGNEVTATYNFNLIDNNVNDFYIQEFIKTINLFLNNSDDESKTCFFDSVNQDLPYILPRLGASRDDLEEEIISIIKKDFNLPLLPHNIHKSSERNNRLSKLRHLFKNYECFITCLQGHQEIFLENLFTFLNASIIDVINEQTHCFALLDCSLAFKLLYNILTNDAIDKGLVIGHFIGINIPEIDIDYKKQYGKKYYEMIKFSLDLTIHPK
jgi:hypothetical protein